MMSTPIGKVKTIFEMSPEEKANFEAVCTAQGITKIEFLRRAIMKAEKEEKKRNERRRTVQSPRVSKSHLTPLRGMRKNWG